MKLVVVLKKAKSFISLPHTRHHYFGWKLLYNLDQSSNHEGQGNGHRSVAD